jgi:hypothetical protein
MEYFTHVLFITGMHSKILMFFSSNSDSIWDIKVVKDVSNGKLKILTKLKEHGNLATLETWGGPK